MIPYFAALFGLLFINVLYKCSGLPAGTNNNKKVILFMLDGFRESYLEQQPLPAFHKLIGTGVKAEYVIPIVPANSYPNWYAIVTGLFAENHGFIQNYMYDEAHNDYFLMAPHPNTSHEHWWNHAEPIWVTAEKNNIRTAMFWWDGCHVEIRGKKPTFCIPYRNYWPWKSVNRDLRMTISTVLDKMKADEFQFALIYHESVDAYGHTYGPRSRMQRKALRNLDRIFKDFLNELEDRQMDEDTTVVVLSDHGMTRLSLDTLKIIDLEEHLNFDLIEDMLDGGAFSILRPYKDKVEEVYQVLRNARIPGLSVFKKDTIPDIFQLKRTNGSIPILLTAEYGYYIKKMSDPHKMKPMHIGEISKGLHGYDPYTVEDMRAIFFARGPDLKVGFVQRPIRIVDIYNLLCYTLGILPLPNNGDWESVRPMIKGQE